MQKSRFRSLYTTALAALSMSAGCGLLEAEGEGAPGGAIHSERDGIGLGVASQSVTSPSQAVDIRRSLAVTDIAILAQFPLTAVVNQLAAQNGNPGFTGTQLFRQLWETQNAAAGPPDLQPSAHCTDNGTSLNGFPNLCRPQEGAQASANNPVNINSYSAIGLFNRFDLAPGNGANCGEYRVVYGKTAGGGRSFIIFEAMLPNPRLDLGLEGCRQVQAFWRDLSHNADVASRATALHDFYFTGLPGYSPVIATENYGFNATGGGQIRVNMFIQPLWDLKEFKLTRQCPGGACVIKAVPSSVKVNPFGDLFSAASGNPLAADFRTHFLTQVGTLALNDINRFNYEVPDQFNAAHSDAQSFGSPDDYAARFAGPSAFRTAIQGQLNALGSALTPDQIVARAEALSCAGCHQRSNGAPLGGGLTFPGSAGFVHSTEFIENPPEGPRFGLSPALVNTFLPFRKGIVEDFLSAVHPVTTIVRFDMAASAADAVNAYWVEDRVSGSVVQASLESGGERAIAFGRNRPIAVASDGTSVYWVEKAGAIFKVPVGGGAITTLATGLTGIAGLATDGIALYWTQGGKAIVRMPVAGGAPSSLIIGRDGVTGRIAVDATAVYWQEGNTIVKAAKLGGAATVLLTRASITGLASDGTDLYLAENLNPGNILKLPVGGGPVTTAFSGSFNLTSVAVGPSNFVWTSNTNPGAVLTKVKD